MADKDRRAVLIPARGGSKRLPRKNILPFLGKPMLEWTIECARASGLFEDIHVSTEDEEIGEVAQAYGAVWVRRPETLSGDRTTVVQVCGHFLDTQEEAGRSRDILVVLYPAAPLRTSEDICRVLASIEEDGADFALTIKRFSDDPCEALIVHEDSTAEAWQPEMLAMRRQDRPTLRVDAGSVYAVRVPAFRRVGNFYGPNMKVVELPLERAVDIDTAEDLARAEFYAGWLERQKAV